MTTPRAILLATLAIIASAAVLVWLSVPRYTLSNLGGGATMRLDRSSGALTYCVASACAPVKPGTTADPWSEFTPASDNVISPADNRQAITEQQ